MDGVFGFQEQMEDLATKAQAYRPMAIKMNSVNPRDRFA